MTPATLLHPSRTLIFGCPQAELFEQFIFIQLRTSCYYPFNQIKLETQESRGTFLQFCFLLAFLHCFDKFHQLSNRTIKRENSFQRASSELVVHCRHPVLRLLFSLFIRTSCVFHARTRASDVMRWSITPSNARNRMAKSVVHAFAMTQFSHNFAACRPTSSRGARSRCRGCRDRIRCSRRSCPRSYDRKRTSLCRQLERSPTDSNWPSLQSTIIEAAISSYVVTMPLASHSRILREMVIAVFCQSLFETDRTILSN